MSITGTSVVENHCLRFVYFISTTLGEGVEESISFSEADFEPKLSLSPLTFGTLKAAFYAMILAAPLAIAAAIYTAYFMAPRMRRKVKPVIELMEAMPTVILGFFAGLSRDIQVDFLTVTMEQIEENPTALDELVNAWAAGDVSTLDQIFHDGMRETDQEVYDVLILNRNANWADQIETLMSGSGSAVIVVGAGHLVGENGVPNMLTERGYSVERVQ